MSNLWILTEERPKKDVIRSLIELTAEKVEKPLFIDLLRIVPEVNDGKFTFRYKVLGCNSNWIDSIYVKTVSGKTSFVDFLVFYQDEEPKKSCRPLFVVEETKTSDSESRNTGVFQRATKFVFIETVYQGIEKYMLYAGQQDDEIKATDTNQFGTNCFLALDVKFVGKQINSHFSRFETVEELIAFKSKMRRPPKGNVPIDVIQVSEDLITVSGRLVKSGGLAHDPNIGALSLIAATLRKLGYDKRIKFVQHGLTQRMINGRNKFIRICNLYNLEIDGITIPVSPSLDSYWYYENSSEKLVTIFLHLMIEEFSNSYSIYENHAGCERGYFFTPDGTELAVKKYTNRDLYKAGDKTAIYALPDLVLLNDDQNEIFNIEGEKASNLSKGIIQLNGFTAFENDYIKKHYPNYRVIRTIVLYGEHSEMNEFCEVSLVLTECGRILLTVSSPDLFKSSVSNLKAYWN